MSSDINHFMTALVSDPDKIEDLLLNLPEMYEQCESVSVYYRIAIPPAPNALSISGYIRGETDIYPGIWFQDVKWCLVDARSPEQHEYFDPDAAQKKDLMQTELIDHVVSRARQNNISLADLIPKLQSKLQNPIGQRTD